MAEGVYLSVAGTADCGAGHRAVALVLGLSHGVDDLPHDFAEDRGEGNLRELVDEALVVLVRGVAGVHTIAFAVDPCRCQDPVVPHRMVRSPCLCAAIGRVAYFGRSRCPGQVPADGKGWKHQKDKKRLLFWYFLCFLAGRNGLIFPGLARFS